MTEQLLSVSRFAKVAGTTRRTLIFYDQKGIFKPEKVASNGYRYYRYQQIYQLGLIFALRDLGLSIKEIKDYLRDPEADALSKKLGPLKDKVEKKISNLQRVLAILRQQEAKQDHLPKLAFYQAQRCYLPARQFWCSDFKADCTEAQIAKAYSDFYWTLGAGVMTNQQLSGFLTDLPQAKPDSYAEAGFRIIKEKSLNETSHLPMIEQSGGEYAIVKVANNSAGIEQGLAQIRQLAASKHWQLGQDLWQFNLGLKIQKLGLTKNSLLAYQIL